MWYGRKYDCWDLPLGHIMALIERLSVTETFAEFSLPIAQYPV